MDHRTIVSFFTCQLVWVNRYSKSPSSDSPAAKAERKKLRRLVAEIRLALNLDTRGIDEN